MWDGGCNRDAFGASTRRASMNPTPGTEDAPDPALGWGAVVGSIGTLYERTARSSNARRAGAADAANGDP